MDHARKHTGNLSRETETVKWNQRTMLENANYKIKKTLFDELNSRQDTVEKWISELERVNRNYPNLK